MSFFKILDKAMSTAEKSIGTASKVASNVEKFKSAYTDYKKGYIPTGIGRINVLGANALSENLSTIGNAVAGDSIKTYRKMIKDANTRFDDARTRLTNMRDMFGLTGSELNALTSGKAKDVLVNKLTKNIVDVEQIISVPIDISKGLPSVADYVNEKYSDVLDNVPTDINEATAYLNENAGHLMKSITSKIPAFDVAAQEGVKNMVSVYKGIANESLGNLSTAAQNVLAGVDIDITYPSISDLQAAVAVKQTFTNIKKIQAAQYGLDCMDKALEMTPEIEAALEAFNNTTWEGIGMGLGDIASYYLDIDSVEEMKSLVTNALAGAPPIQAATKKLSGIMQQANNAIKTCEDKVAEATSTIESIFDLFS